MMMMMMMLNWYDDVPSLGDIRRRICRRWPAKPAKQSWSVRWTRAPRRAARRTGILCGTMTAHQRRHPSWSDRRWSWVVGWRRSWQGRWCRQWPASVATSWWCLVCNDGDLASARPPTAHYQPSRPHTVYPPRRRRPPACTWTWSSHWLTGSPSSRSPQSRQVACRSRWSVTWPRKTDRLSDCVLLRFSWLTETQ